MTKAKYVQFGALMELREENRKEDQKYCVKLDGNLKLAINGEDYDSEYLTVKTNTDDKFEYVRFDVFAGGLKVGSILENKDGNGFYFSRDRDVKFHLNGDEFKNKYIGMETPINKLNWFLENGYTTQEKYDERVEKIPEFIKYEFTAKFT